MNKSMNFDTLLFGNGLTISLFSKISGMIKPFDSYFIEFLETSYFNKKEFYQILNSNNNSIVYLEARDIINVENFLLHNKESIIECGFEVWIGNKVFVENDYLIKDTSCYYLALYNYWYCKNKKFFDSDIFQRLIDEYEVIIKNLGCSNIFTINYDKFFDLKLNVKHIHGKFVDNFFDVEQLVCQYYNNMKSFYYCMCQGTNGYEKLFGLHDLNKKNNVGYDYDFMFSKTKSYGNILIFGVRFADTFIIPDIIKNKYSEADIKLIKYVDGHIMERLDVLYLNNRLKAITICYFDEKALERYKRVFEKNKCKAIINYINSECIIK